MGARGIFWISCLGDKDQAHFPLPLPPGSDDNFPNTLPMVLRFDSNHIESVYHLLCGTAVLILGVLLCKCDGSLYLLYFSLTSFGNVLSLSLCDS